MLHASYEAGMIDPSVRAIMAEISPSTTHSPGLTTASTIETSDDQQQLANLLIMPHRSYTLQDIADEQIVDDSANYFDPAYESEYLANLDAQLDDQSLYEDPNRPLRPG